MQRQIAEENRLLKEAVNSDDSVPDVNMPRKEFRILKNRELPMRFAHYDRVKLSQQKFPAPNEDLIYDGRSGEIKYFPRKGAFEIYFRDTVVHSHIDTGTLPEDMDALATRIIALAEAPKRLRTQAGS